MKSTRNSAILTGVLFIIAAVASIIGLLLYQPILHDPGYIIKGTGAEIQVLWGAFFEIITAFAVIGTPIALFPILKKYNESMALSCIAFRLLEATIIIIGIISLLTIVTLNHEFSNELNPNNSSYLVTGKLLVAIHDWTFLFGPNLILGPSTLMTGYLLYTSKLVPRSIAVLGLIGGPMIFTCAILVLFGAFPQISFWGGLFAIPVFLYEMSLAIWLLVKGFNAPEADPVTVFR
ncbi:MAG: DUF4386 domain-containing protein [Saprospiraceae bacterium]